MDNSYVFKFPTSLNTCLSTHECFGHLFSSILDSRPDKIFLDFSKSTFIASNQFAVLGCIIESYIKLNPNASIFITNMSQKLTSIIQKNGFGKHFGLSTLPDEHNTVIPYYTFRMCEIDEFEKHIVLNIFSRSDLPVMSEQARNTIIDNILEIFNNVKEHTKSTHVYTCGQFFPKSSILYFTIVDSGETIPYNVNNHLSEKQSIYPEYTIEWAMTSGNTTRAADTPGGLGLSILDSFVKINEGRLYIVSGAETFERNKQNSRFKKLRTYFPGTIVTVGFNLSDTKKICMSNEDISEIIF